MFGGLGVGAWNVGGASHDVFMINTEQCERCEGSGADPMQGWFDEEVTLCVECRGDGMLVVIDERYELALPLSA